MELYSFENNMKCGNIEALVLIAMYLKEAATGSFSCVFTENPDKIPEDQSSSLCLFINTVALFNGSKATLRRKCDLLSDYGAGFGITFFKKIMIFQNRVLGRD